MKFAASRTNRDRRDKARMVGDIHVGQIVAHPSQVIGHFPQEKFIKYCGKCGAEFETGSRVATNCPLHRKRRYV